MASQKMVVQLWDQITTGLNYQDGAAIGEGFQRY